MATLKSILLPWLASNIDFRILGIMAGISDWS